MKRNRSLIYNGMLLTSDLVAMLSSCYLTYSIYAYLRPASVDLMKYLMTVPLAVGVWFVIFKIFNLYEPKRSTAIIIEVRDIAVACIVSASVLLAVVYLYHGMVYSRLIIGLFIIINTVFLTVSRITGRKILRHIRRKGYNTKRVLIVGAGSLGRRLAEGIAVNSWLGFDVVGYLDDNMAKGHIVEGKEILGCVRDINEVISEMQVDQVFIALPMRVYKKMMWIINKLTLSTVDVRIVPDIYPLLTLNASLADLDGMLLINVAEAPIHGWDRLFKRLIDITVSFFALLITAPTMVVLGILIKATSPGPVFYRQERMGLDGKPFQMLKFRSMVADAESKSGAVWAAREDQRRTRIGAFMRKTSLDELPQFLNVLKGEMSVVGPRPERPVFIKEFKNDIKGYMLRHKVKSGITGWAQVHGLRGNTSLSERIKHDLYYIENWSLWLDIKIIFLTVFFGLVNPNAY